VRPCTHRTGLLRFNEKLEEQHNKDLKAKLQPTVTFGSLKLKLKRISNFASYLLAIKNSVKTKLKLG